MKKQDLYLIVVIVVISAVMSFLISGQLFNSPQKRQQEAEVVQPIATKLSLPDKRFFNDTSINITRVISISQNNNNDPFSKPKQ